MQERLLTMNIKISKEKYDKLLKEETERLEKELAHSIFPTIKFMVNSSLKSEGLDGETSMKDVQLKKLKRKIKNANLMLDLKGQIR